MDSFLNEHSRKNSIFNFKEFPIKMDLINFFGSGEHINPTRRCKVCTQDRQINEFLPDIEACKNCIKRCTTCNNYKEVGEFYEGKTVCKKCILIKKKDKYHKNRKSKVYKDADSTLPNFYEALRSTIGSAERFYSKSSFLDKITGKYIHTITFLPTNEIIYRSDVIDLAYDRVHLLHFALLRSGFKYETPPSFKEGDGSFNNNLEKKLTFDEVVDRQIKQDTTPTIDYMNMMNSISKSFDNIRATVDLEYKNIQTILLQNILSQKSN